jgi:dihydroorotase
MGYIDRHVHFRDWNESYKFTIKEGMKLARSQGIVAVCDMPNTNPQMNSFETVDKRIATARDSGCEKGYYVYCGVTTDPIQLKDAVRAAREHPKCVGLKMFAGPSTGNLGITNVNDQLSVYQNLVSLDYDGELVVHCERTDKFNEQAWNPQRPYTWNIARPPEAEIASIQDQIDFALQTGFKGTLHIAHVSTAKGVSIIRKARENLDITCGATIHHLSMSTDSMREPHSVIYKVNPPIRESYDMLGLRHYLTLDAIDYLETDQAPHTEEEKLLKHLSGIRSMERYRLFVMSLQSILSENQMYVLTYGNAKRRILKILE